MHDNGTALAQRVEPALFTGQPLHDDTGALVDQDGHGLGGLLPQVRRFLRALPHRLGCDDAGQVESLIKTINRLNRDGKFAASAVRPRASNASAALPRAWDPLKLVWRPLSRATRTPRSPASAV